MVNTSNWRNRKKLYDQRPNIMLRLVPLRDRVVHDSQQSKKKKGNTIWAEFLIFDIKFFKKAKNKVFHNLFGGKSGPDFIWVFHKSLLIQLSVHMFHCRNIKIFDRVLDVPSDDTVLSSYLPRTPSHPI